MYRIFIIFPAGNRGKENSGDRSIGENEFFAGNIESEIFRSQARRRPDKWNYNPAYIFPLFVESLSLHFHQYWVYILIRFSASAFWTESRSKIGALNPAYKKRSQEIFLPYSRNTLKLF